MLPRLLVLLPFLALSPGSGRAAELRTLPQNLEACQELAARLAPLPGARREPARGLAAEGHTLCQEGNFRTGVSRLRRALRAAQGH